MLSLGLTIKAQSDCNFPMIAGNIGSLQYNSINITLNGATYDSLSLDLDEDGNFDVLFIAYYHSIGFSKYSETAIVLLNPNIEIITDTILPSRLNSNDSISVCKHWLYTNQHFVFAEISIEPGMLYLGNWLNQGSGYVGFRLNQITDTLYGWFSLNSLVTETGSQLSINGFVLQSTTTAIYNTELSENDITIFPNPTSDILSIKIPKNINSAIIIITNIEGKTITRQSGNNIISISVTDFPSGIYYIQILTDNILLNKKFIKQ